MSEEKVHEALEMTEAITTAVGVEFLCDAPLSELRGMKKIVENVRENVQEADMPRHHREDALEAVDEMMRGINGVLRIRED